MGPLRTHTNGAQKPSAAPANFQFCLFRTNRIPVRDCFLHLVDAVPGSCGLERIVYIGNVLHALVFPTRRAKSTHVSVILSLSSSLGGVRSSAGTSFGQ